MSDEAMVPVETLSPRKTRMFLLGALAVAGLGMGIAMPPLGASVAVSVDDDDYGIAGAAQQMMVQVGVVFGIQLMQTVQQARIDVVGQAASYHWGYLTGLAMALVGVATATRIASAAPRSPAAELDLELDVEAGVTTAPEATVATP